MRFGVAVLLLSGCLTAGANTVEDEGTHLYQVCLEFCSDKYSDAYGVEARRAKDKVVRCLCRRHRGDTVDYINVEEYESDEATEVDVLHH